MSLSFSVSLPLPFSFPLSVSSAPLNSPVRDGEEGLFPVQSAPFYDSIVISNSVLDDTMSVATAPPALKSALSRQFSRQITHLSFSDIEVKAKGLHEHGERERGKGE